MQVSNRYAILGIRRPGVMSVSVWAREDGLTKLQAEIEGAWHVLCIRGYVTVGSSYPYIYA